MAVESAIILAEANLEELSMNPFPGSGIVMGRSEDGRLDVQIYWVMGRMEGSRNRILVFQEGIVRTEPYFPSKIWHDPGLIFYNNMKVSSDRHQVVSNGSQTDLIAGDEASDELYDVLWSVKHETDAPNFTPRISGIFYNRATDPEMRMQFSKISCDPSNPEESVHAVYEYRSLPPGLGYCLHTYNGDGNPLPSFNRDPYLVPIPKPVEIAGKYWQALNRENRVALAVKGINRETGKVHHRIVNAHNTQPPPV